MEWGIKWLESPCSFSNPWSYYSIVPPWWSLFPCRRKEIALSRPRSYIRELAEVTAHTVAQWADCPCPGFGYWKQYSHQWQLWTQVLSAAWCGADLLAELLYWCIWAISAHRKGSDRISTKPSAVPWQNVGVDEWALFTNSICTGNPHQLLLWKASWACWKPMEKRSAQTVQNFVGFVLRSGGPWNS